MSKVPKYIAIKYMCRILYKRSKECNVEGVEDTRYRFQCIKCYVCRRRRRWCLRLLRNTVCRVCSVYSGQNTLQLNTCVEYCTKDQRNAMSKVSKIHGTDFNALNAMYVEDVGDGVCGFYATLYAEYTLYTVAPRPARREGSL